MNRVYALMTRKCNLTCPYCDVKDKDDGYDHDKFIQALRSFDGNVVLFGGEPTLFRDRLKDVLYDEYINPKITSITTNLMVIDDEMIQLLKDCRNVSTSWNPSRFRDGEYDIWKSNLHKLSGHITLRVLITITFDLLTMIPHDVASIISTWDQSVVGDIMFENLIDEQVDENYFDKAGDWLCAFYDEIITRTDIPPITCNMGWNEPKCFDCTNIYTMEPDGTIKNGCPHTSKMYIPEKCYSCELADKCRPCRLQRYCSFPLKLYKKLESLRMNKKNEDGGT